jgi:hypothetical protein
MHAPDSKFFDGNGEYENDSKNNKNSQFNSNLSI